MENENKNYTDRIIFKSIFTDSINKNEHLCNKKQFEKHILELSDYTQLLLEWNEKINLTAITNIEDIIVKHYIDSLSILRYIGDGKKIIDVGTGAGFPGIPLKIFNSTLDITLLDSLNKRVVFLDDVINKLKLNNIKAVHSRAEDYAKEYKEKYDVACSRAVADMPTLVEYLLPFVKLNGIAICMKGKNIDEEIKRGEKAIKLLGGKIEKIDKIFLMLNGEQIERNIVIIRKVSNTPKEFPRKPSKAQKEPIV